MKKYIISGGGKLSGEVTVSGSKNVVLKAVIAACLTDEEVVLTNVPLISDLFAMLELVKEIGGSFTISDHTVRIKLKKIINHKIPLDTGAKIRTSSMFLAPLLARVGEALIPNPGGCRIGARPIDRHIEGLEKMGALITYMSQDGYFHAKTKKLKGVNYTFLKNSHTGTETLILAAALAEGVTVLENAAEEPEIDDLIGLLSRMGAKIKRAGRKITVIGVKKLHGAEFKISPDRNEVVTYAIASALTGGDVTVKGVELSSLVTFLEKFKEAGGSWEEQDGGVRFFAKEGIKPVDIVTGAHPSFMTDWQGPWAVFMTQAEGVSKIHETVYENRFSYKMELEKMGAKISFYNPKITDPENFYNFNYDPEHASNQAIKIKGKTPLHNAVIEIADLRAGATLVIAALIAKGESIIYGIEHLDRGYESFDERLKRLGAKIEVSEEVI